MLERDRVDRALTERRCWCHVQRVGRVQCVRWQVRPAQPTTARLSIGAHEDDLCVRLWNALGSTFDQGIWPIGELSEQRDRQVLRGEGCCGIR
eukprot:4520735-Pyramimonas_sp.AAC.1